jgi:hypothetical protein
MEASPQSTEAFYAETSHALRHYSELCFRTRALTVAQGLVVLGAAGYLTSRSLFFESSCSAVFASVLSFVLWGLHANYYGHFDAMLEKAVELERILGNDNLAGPWRLYDNRRKRIRQRAVGAYRYHYGTFILVMVSSVLLIGYNAVAWLLS